MTAGSRRAGLARAATTPSAWRGSFALRADDHGVLREGIAGLVDAQADMTVVGQAGDAENAVALCQSLEPEVAVVDLSMPGGGLNAVERIGAAAPKTRVLVLTMHDDPAYLRRVLTVGGAGFLVKAAAGADLLEAIRQVASGHAFVRVSLSDQNLRAVTESAAPAGEEVAELSGRERQVLALLARGLTNREIAAQLRINKKTIDTYRVRLQDKLGVSGRAELFACAQRAGLLRDIGE